METSLVAGTPTPLSAVHLNAFESCLLMLSNGMATMRLSQSLVHVIVGVGFPSAEHFSVKFPPSVTVSPVTSLMIGGTGKTKVQV